MSELLESSEKRFGILYHIESEQLFDSRIWTMKSRSFRVTICLAFGLK